MSLQALFKLLCDFPNALSGANLLKVSSFLTHAPKLKNHILLAQESNWPPEVAPWILPESIEAFLADVCGTSSADIGQLWLHLKETVWEARDNGDQIDIPSHIAATHKALGTVALFPPLIYCPNYSGTCDRKRKGLKLQKADQSKVVVYTLDKGARPGWAIRLQCEGCSTAYYHNYFVKDGSRYYYHGEIPGVLQVGEHQFVEKRVIEMWRTDVNIAWKSFTNCARTYQTTFSKVSSIPDNWPTQDALKGDHIQDGFIILSLLDDHLERKVRLMVPHTGEQANRFKEAIHERNMRIKLYGLKEILHRCKKCTRIYEPERPGAPQKSVWVAVMDGITLGHPTCAVHNCKIPLTVSRDHYCPTHAKHNFICAIKDCNSHVLEGKRTCAHADHQEVERVYTLRGQSRVQLQEKLRRQRVSHPDDGLPIEDEGGAAQLIDDEEEEEIEISSSDLIHGAIEGVSDPRGTEPLATVQQSAQEQLHSLTKRISARFGRKRTHNEQILVAPCGVILARETFYGAEAISTCAEFIKRTFRINGQAPNHLFFDNNCTLAKHVKNDPFFRDIGLTVDVFHFNCKHSIRDVFCQTNCNPAIYKELHGENSKAWFFNSSIAEQTNVWLGGFHAIVREMHIDRYNFFLDQMILMRNKMTVVKLEKNGSCPIIRSLHQ